MSFSVSPFTPPRCCTSGQKGGVAPSTNSPSRAARRCVGRGGTREAQPRFAFPQRMREIRVVPRLMRRFGKVQNHNGGGLAL